MSSTQTDSLSSLRGHSRGRDLTRKQGAAEAERIDAGKKQQQSIFPWVVESVLNTELHQHWISLRSAVHKPIRGKKVAVEWSIHLMGYGKGTERGVLFFLNLRVMYVCDS